MDSVNSVTCLECGKILENGRSSKKFCSTNCRVKYNRKVGKEEMVTIPKLEYDQLRSIADKVINPEVRTLPELAAAVGDVAPSGLKFKNKKKVDELPLKEYVAVETAKNDDNGSKWQLRRPVMKVPENLKGIARQAWIADWKKNNH